MSESFFKNLKEFSDFIDVCNEKNFMEAPSDWHIIMSDVRNSTKSIESGDYRKVNLAGAAAITAIQNINRAIDIPFVFGGDGSTLLVPPNIVEEAKKELRKIRALFQESFGLDLRVGIMPISELVDDAKVLVAKYRMNNISLAMFKGGGLKMAESLIKSGKYELPPEQEGKPNLEGLSCRWEPLQSKKGTMLSLIVMVNNNDMAIYRQVIESINKITGEPKPISLGNLKVKWPPKGFSSEAITSKGGYIGNLIKLFIVSVMAYIFFKFKLKTKDFEPEKYRQEIVMNADYRKFDDMLRMVIDCSKDEADKIEEYLKTLKKDGVIFYGTHRSDSALMTCLVFSLQKEGHTHFIDGNDGGYTMAATMMKKQIQQAKTA